MANKILITGAAGFIGSHLTEYLLKKNYSITAFDRYNSFNSFGWLDNFSNKKLKCVLGDIRDFDSVNNVVKNHDIVMVKGSNSSKVHVISKKLIESN